VSDTYGLTPNALGVHLGRLYVAGKTDLPAAAQDFTDAWIATPVSISSTTARGGGIGHDPGSVMDKLFTLMNDAMTRTSTRLDEVGAALVAAAELYLTTDQDVRDGFKSAAGELPS
jgi:hypothetical protein